MGPMNGENRLIVTNEPVVFENNLWGDVAASEGGKAKLRL